LFLFFFTLISLSIINISATTHDDLDKKNIACTTEYSPVCGYNPENENLKTFDNQCLLEKDEIFGYLHFGKCIANNLDQLRHHDDAEMVF